MNGFEFGAFGALVPELILLTGGLLILIIGAVQGSREDSGLAYMMVAILFLAAGLVGSLLLINKEPQTVTTMLSVDPFSTFLKIAVYTGMLLVAVAGGTYINSRSRGHAEFWSLYLFVTLAMSLAVSATNLLMIFLAIEFLSITSYILVGFLRDDRRSTEAGVKYFLYGSVSSSVMLYGMSLLYGASGSLDLAAIGQALADNPDVTLVVIPATLLIMVGLGFKASLAPFYQWAPDTYDGAPTPITAYLSTASKAVGFAITARLLIVALGGFVTDWVPILAGLSVLTMSIGNLAALRQTSVKRMLAYSSVAQAGYILLGLVAVVSSAQADLATLTVNGLNGVLIYLFAYLFTNVGAFMVVHAVEMTTGRTDIDAYNGLVQRAPGLAVMMLIFLLSLTGIPATGGFIGKFYVFGATVQRQYFWLAIIAVINVGISAYYYLNVARAMFFGRTEEEAEETTGAQPTFAAAIPVQIILLICVGATLWIGLYPATVIDLANAASRYLLTLTL